MPDFVRVASLADLASGQPRCAEVNGRRIGLVSVDGSVHAFDDRCPHAEASLCEGTMAGDEIVCPLHHATFEVHTGRCTGPPADEDIAVYPVRIEGDAVYVSVEP